ncbi:fatty acid desaturase [Gluconacetobacter tumulisoli]|uniref:Fatty acid desaturase n=1 Tax=Gluconacetobacter tumulisoli TaxID=1286189 RepID=A0A7W4KAC4_9PROT|nr:fatty acid desaturase [Gluconacetobacter tumulisoli]MBB2203205.1 fatty acid desaturase [Gluconacetobacter tumulisoli]
MSPAPAGHSARQREVEWPTFLAIASCYGVWILAGTFLYGTSHLLSLAVLALVVAFHSSLQHEALHRHPTSSDRLNEILVGLPVGLFYPFRRYRTTHLDHHRDELLTDPDEDPETYYHHPARWARLPRARRWLLEANNTFLGRVILGPLIGSVSFFLSDMRRIAAGDRVILVAWVIHALSLVPVVWVVTRVFGMPFWLYLFGPAYAGTALIGIRSYCEHRWAEQPSCRTILVQHSVLSFLFLYNNLHIVHHSRPGIPWYRLPRTYRADRAYWHALNGGYVYRGYWEIAWRYLLRRKEPLPHPAPHLPLVPVPRPPHAAQPMENGSC